MKIYVLLASYNGSDYIGETLESVFGQEVPAGFDVKVILSDDSSSDNTLDIVKKQFSQVCVISHSRKGCAVRNFKFLIDNCPLDGDLYFFADQDDYWLPEKLKLFIDRYFTLDNHKPVLIFSDLSVVNKDLNIIHSSMFSSCHHNPQPTFSQLMVQNPITGCVMAVNQKAIRLVRDMDFNDVVMHDWMLGLICKAHGELEFIDHPTILYRQHGNNVIGAVKREISPLFMHPAKLFNFLKASAVQWQKHIRQLFALELFFKKSSLPVPNVLQAFLNSLSSGFLSRLNCFLFMGVRKYGFKRNIVFFMIYVLKLFAPKNIDESSK